MKSCLIIGGGIIGLCTAYYLQKEGHKVIVLDQSSMDGGASYVNAGYISPSHIVPLSSPGVVKKGLQWMFDPASPFYVKPRLNPDFLRWAWAFNKSCTKKHVMESVKVIRDISVFSRELYRDLTLNPEFNFHFEQKGLLMVCKTEQMLEEEMEVSKMAIELGLETNSLNQKELKDLEPAISPEVIGAVHYQCDAHSTPHEFMSSMKSHLRSKGVVLKPNEKVVDIETANNCISSVITDKMEYKAEEFIFTAGSWTGQLSKKVGINLLLQAGKGYRIDVARKTGINFPAILAEAKTAVTPMNGFTRFAGTMEISGISKNVNPVRVNAIANAAHEYYPDVQFSEDELASASSGLRPLSPDGLPYIGRSGHCKNLMIATGHAMMGWTMGTGTGKLVSEVISEHKTSLDLGPFSPDRTF